MVCGKKFDDVANEYFRFLGRNKNTSEYTIRSVYKNHIEQLFGKKKMRSIKMNDMRLLQDVMINKKYRGKKYSNKTINNTTDIFNMIINFAVLNGYINTNLCANYKTLKIIKNHEVVDFWTDDQFIKAISFEKKFKWYSFLTISYLTGMRKGEMRGLKWKDVDFEKNLIHIKRHINDKRIHDANETEDKEWIIPGRKNEVNEHILLIDHSTRNLLLKLLNDSERCYNFDDNLFIFGGERPVGQNEPKRHLDKIAKLSGMPRIKVHGLRHSHVSFLISKGLNAYEIAERIGDTVEMVLKVYGHMFPNPQENIVKALDESFDF